MVRILSLLMLSNVAALRTISDSVGTASTITDAGTDADNMKAEVEEILKLQFAEPLPQIIKRAQKASKTMTVKEALLTSGHKMTDDIRGLVEGRNVTREINLRASSKGSVAQMQPGGLAKPSVFDRAMAFITNEYKVVREELDLKLLECGFFKLQKEGLLFETQDKLDEIAMDMGLAEATMNACQAEIQKQNDIIEVKLLELHKLTTWCKITHDELETIRSAAEEDYRIITLILEVAKEECAKQAANGFLQVHACLGSDGTAHFQGSGLMQEQASKFKQTSSQQAFQRMLFGLYGIDENPLPGKLNLKALDDFDDDDSDDFPEDDIEDQSKSGSGSLVQMNRSAPDAGTSNAASNDDLRERCSNIAAKPRCANILDKLDGMQGELWNALQVATKNLQMHDTQCETDIGEINAEIATCRNIIATQTEQFDKTSAFHNGMAIEHGQETVFKRELCKELRAKFKECYEKCKELEREMCGLLKIRQAVYNKIKNPDGSKPQLMIEDCMMSDWVVGECSGTCLDANGNSGIQLIKRAPMQDWSNTTEAGKYGASCPPDEVSRDCADEQCPIDCVMKDWSMWSECTAQCGGGSETRTRGVLTPDDFGGAKCASNSESDACNTQSCDTDCVLSDWTGWSPCTKSCKASWRARPGIQTRTKSIATPTIGGGKCWKEKTPERWEKQFCNTFACPKIIECVASMDVVLVQDGSGSLRYRGRGRKGWPRNFELSKDFMLKFVQMSKLAKADEFGKIGDGLRYGVVLYSFNAKEVIAITHEKDKIVSAVKGMKWPKGGTMTDRALLKAKSMFGLAVGGAKRLQVIVLITDGKASRRKWAADAAHVVKKSGIRLVVIPVKGALRNEAEMCSWATFPCKENMINTPRWPMLISKLKLYLTTMCPTVVDPTLQTTL